MPIYEFECGACGERFEELVQSGTETAVCRHCGAPRAERRLSSFGLSRQPTAGQRRRMEDARGTNRGGARDRFQKSLDRGRERRPKPPSEAGRTTEDAAARRERLVEVYREASTCTLCPLAQTRTKVVFGAGDANADLMFVGEAPGAEEDRQGLPFVGRAGGLLNELLAGIGLRREDVFIANTLLCRPPGNRDPEPIELDTCRPYLLQKVDLIQPKVIATLGNFATKLITGSQVGITKVRGRPQVHTLGERTLYVFPILHPAAILRSPGMRPTMDEDFASLRELIDAPPLEQDLLGEPEILEAGLPAAATPAEDQLDFFTLLS